MANPGDIQQAGDADWADVRQLLSEYAAWLGVDLGFQDFERERCEIPGRYALPAGALLIARDADVTVGMVALRPMADGRCEMKRLFVRASARGTGLGRRLTEHIIAEARRRGYRAMLLDTLPVMQDAQRLYAALGFRDVPAYYESPIAGTRYMQLDL